MGVLAAILDAKRREVVELRARGAIGTTPRPTMDVVSRLRREPGEPLRLLCEIKRRSPSAGPLSTVLSPRDRALAYERGGAAAISVLTDRGFFDGSFEHLAAVATACAIPALAKEFVIDPVQLEAARAAGARLVLLIARIVDAALLRELVAAARSLDLEPLVEVVTDDELDAALAADARIVGVNARDLDTLAMDRARAARVLARVPASCVAVHLSGLKSAEDVASVARSRVDAALLGEALMRLVDPSALVGELVAAAGGPWRAR